MPINTISPVARNTPISIDLKDYERFKELFWSEKVYAFHVNGKQVTGTKIIFQVRSMRVNEFCDILDLNLIKWQQ